MANNTLAALAARLARGEDIDYYDLLNVPRHASPDDLGAAYRRQARAYHPDRNPREHRDAASAVFRAVSEAYEVLCDPRMRRIYDAHGRAGVLRASAGHSNEDTPPPYQHQQQHAAPHFAAFPDFPGFAGFPNFPPFPLQHQHFAFSDPHELFRRMFGAASDFSFAAAAPMASSHFSSYSSSSVQSANGVSREVHTVVRNGVRTTTVRETDARGRVSESTSTEPLGPAQSITTTATTRTSRLTQNQQQYWHQ